MSESTSIESEVPGEQKLREGEARADKENSTLITGAKAQTSLQEGASERNATLSTGDTGEIATPDDFTLEPVITVTKQESTLTKGEMKLQKVTVTEDISVRYQHLFKKQTTPGKTVVTTVQRLDYKY